MIRNSGCFLLRFLLCASLIVPLQSRCWAEDVASLPDSPSPAPQSPDRSHPGEQVNNVTWRNLPITFLRDQRDIWLFPTQLARGRHWIPTLAVVGGTAGLIYADPHIARYFRNHARNIDKVNDVFDPFITTGEVMAVPTLLIAGGYARHRPYAVSTALMSAEAYGDSAIVNLAIKAVTRRQRPSDVAPTGTFTGTFFNGGKSPLKGSSFPSGHSTGAFAVAAVVSGRYPNHHWVPLAMYTMATAISLSRISTNAHFSSDVFLGASIGYSIAKFQVLRPR